ncbi:unnamed protein product [Pedinophyceae sp. YPF-701]|nr:unnamed protein product [Pedinophyceae sp. YPF-701]
MAKERSKRCVDLVTFTPYKPSRVDVGLPHPDCVVESTALASIVPPDAPFQHQLEILEFAKTGSISQLQFEAVVYAFQSNEHTFVGDKGTRQRYAFLLADGTGVGKGRTIAAIIWENWLRGRRRHVWLSAKKDLKADAERDFREIGATDLADRVVTLQDVERSAHAGADGILFVPYTMLREPKRFRQVCDWCDHSGRGAFSGNIVFDESHKGKNLQPAGHAEPTATAVAMENLQDAFPDARVVYSSATGASEPRNMAYMGRLNLWGPHSQMDLEDFPAFSALFPTKDRNLGSAELLSTSLKATGRLVCRTLSFEGADFYQHRIEAAGDFRVMYDCSTQLWRALHGVVLSQYADVCFRLSGASSGGKKTEKAQFKGRITMDYYGTQQKFFKSLCYASKLEKAAELVQAARDADMCPVVGLFETGEAAITQLNNSVTRDIPSMARHELTSYIARLITQLETYVECHRHRCRRPFRLRETVSEGDCTNNSASDDDLSGVDFEVEDEPDKDEERDAGDAQLPDVSYEFSDYTNDSASDDSSDLDFKVEDEPDEDEEDAEERGAGDAQILDVSGVAEVRHRLEDLLSLATALPLPVNALDTLWNRLGGSEQRVADLTGRQHYMVKVGNGYEVRKRRLDENRERKAFQDGEKDVAIVSAAGSIGISLQADGNAQNHRRRAVISLEFPWAADAAVQQWGRAHRSGQVSCPEFHLVVAGVGGELRFASAVAKRIESLGALMHGDRRAADSQSLSDFNCDIPHGQAAVRDILCAVEGDTFEGGAGAGRAGKQVALVEPRHCFEGFPDALQPPEREKHFLAEIRHMLILMGFVTPLDPTQQTDVSARDRPAFFGKVVLQQNVVKQTDQIRVFLNRVLAVDIAGQDILTTLLFDQLHMRSWIDPPKDCVAQELPRGCVRRTEPPVELCRDDLSGATTMLHRVEVDRGLPAERAVKFCERSVAHECDVRVCLAEGQAASTIVSGFYRRRVSPASYHDIHLQPSWRGPALALTPRSLVVAAYKPHMLELGSAEGIEFMSPANCMVNRCQMKDFLNMYSLVHDSATVRRDWDSQYDGALRKTSERNRKEDITFVSGNLLPIWKEMRNLNVIMTMTRFSVPDPTQEAGGSEGNRLLSIIGVQLTASQAWKIKDRVENPGAAPCTQGATVGGNKRPARAPEHASKVLAVAGPPENRAGAVTNAGERPDLSLDPISMLVDSDSERSHHHMVVEFESSSEEDAAAEQAHAAQSDAELDAAGSDRATSTAGENITQDLWRQVYDNDDRIQALEKLLQSISRQPLANVQHSARGPAAGSEARPISGTETLTQARLQLKQVRKAQSDLKAQALRRGRRPQDDGAGPSGL